MQIINRIFKSYKGRKNSFKILLKRNKLKLNTIQKKYNFLKKILKLKFRNNTVQKNQQLKHLKEIKAKLVLI